MNFLGRCNGSGSFGKNLSPVTVALVTARIPTARILFIEEVLGGREENGEYLTGHRFCSDERVIDRIRSVADDAEVARSPMEWALDALRDCASADHWYEYEKQWD